MSGADWDRLLALAVEAGRYGFVLLDGVGLVLHVNDAVCELLRRPRSDLLEVSISSLLHPDDRRWVQAELELLLAGRIDRLRYETRLVAGDGSHVWAELNARSACVDERVRAVVMFEDAGNRVLREHELRRLADTDPLTDLYNRRRFAAELEHHLMLAERYGARGSLLMLDIDELKRINDAHGHAAGDRTITLTAEVLRARVRVSDVVARLGGDEFAVLLPAADGTEAALVAAALLAEMSGRSQADGVTATLSIGLSTVAEGTDATSLLDAADAAMYEAKRRGGNSFAIRDQAPSAPPRSDHPRRRHRDTSDAGPDRAPENTARADAGNLGVDIEAVLQTVSELGSASLGLLAWELCVDRRAVATAWTAAIRDGMLKPAGYDSLDHEWQYELTSTGQARAHPTDTPSAHEPARHARHNNCTTPPAMEGPARSRSSRRRTRPAKPKPPNQT